MSVISAAVWPAIHFCVFTNAVPVGQAARPLTGIGATRGEADAPSRLVSRVVFLAGLAFATLLFLFPFIWLVSASLKERQDVFSGDLLKFPLHFENYVTIFQICSLGSLVPHAGIPYIRPSAIDAKMFSGFPP